LPPPEINVEGNQLDPRSELAAQLPAYEQQYRHIAEIVNEQTIIFPEAAGLKHNSCPQADLCSLPTGTSPLLTTVLATLELFAQQSISVVQHKPFGSIVLLRKA